MTMLAKPCNDAHDVSFILILEASEAAWLFVERLDVKLSGLHDPVPVEVMLIQNYPLVSSPDRGNAVNVHTTTAEGLIEDIASFGTSADQTYIGFPQVEAIYGPSHFKRIKNALAHLESPWPTVLAVKASPSKPEHNQISNRWDQRFQHKGGMINLDYEPDWLIDLRGSLLYRLDTWLVATGREIPETYTDRLAVTLSVLRASERLELLYIPAARYRLPSEKETDVVKGILDAEGLLDTQKALGYWEQFNVLALVEMIRRAKSKAGIDNDQFEQLLGSIASRVYPETFDSFEDFPVRHRVREAFRLRYHPETAPPTCYLANVEPEFEAVSLVYRYFGVDPCYRVSVNNQWVLPISEHETTVEYGGVPLCIEKTLKVPQGELIQLWDATGELLPIKSKETSHTHLRMRASDVAERIERDRNRRPLRFQVSVEAKIAKRQIFRNAASKLRMRMNAIFS